MKLFGVISGFIGFFKSREQGSAVIDNPAFRLHYDFTAGFFFLSTALLSLNDIFGSPIQCKGYHGGSVASAPGAALQWCLVSGTFTVPDSVPIHKNLEGIGAAGKDHEENICKRQFDEKLEYYRYSTNGDISPLNSTEKEKYKDDPKVPKCKKQHNYYQWVQFLFVLQGILFIVPHKIWSSIEEGKMASISNGVTKANQQKEEDRQNMVKNIARFVDKDTSLYNHRKYAYGFFFCQFLNLANVIFNIWLLNHFIEGEFINLGSRWMLSVNGTGNQLLKEVFPRMTLCDWKTRGTAGGENSVRYMCILATNIITEKIFVFLWFWLFLLLLISTIVLFYFGIMLFSNNENIRNYFLAFTIRMKVSKLRIRDSAEKDEKKKVVKYLRKLPSTNFFFLYLLASNVDYRCLQDLLKEIEQRKRDVK